MAFGANQHTANEGGSIGPPHSIAEAAHQEASELVVEISTSSATRALNDCRPSGEYALGHSH